MKGITIRDVAEAANVSVGTVSMVLNGSEKVSEFTRQHVQRTIDALGYRRNPHARSLSQNKSYNIGLIVTDLTNPFFGAWWGCFNGKSTSATTAWCWHEPEPDSAGKARDRAAAAH
jgi:hypothetical protein